MGKKEKKLLKLLSENKKKGIIFDLRGTPGGSDSLLFSLASTLRPSSYLKNQTYRTHQVLSIKSTEGFVKTLRDIHKKYPKANYGKILKKFEKKLDVMKKQNFQKKVEVKDWTNELVSKKEFLPAKVAILVDEGCASACELFVALFHKDPNVRVIGTPTKGRFLYGNPSEFDLGTYKIRPTNMYNDFQFSAKELFGFTPDIISLNKVEQEKFAEQWLIK